MKLLIAKSIGYMILIGLGYMLKQVGIFQKTAKDVLGIVLMYITLPCAFIANFQSFAADYTLAIYIVIGLFANLVMIFIGYMVSYKKNVNDKALYMIDCSGYNIGAFTTPVVASCLSPESVLITSMFDIGNCMISVGGVYPLAKRQIEGRQKRFLGFAKYFVMKLFQSVPFDTYFIMLVLSIMGIRMPETVNQVAAQIGAPSIILTMIMIGITFEINISTNEIKDVFLILIIRYVFAVIFSVIIWKVALFSITAKKILTICFVAPTTSISPNYCNMCHCNPHVYGAVSSLTVPCSLIAIIIIMSIM